MSHHDADLMTYGVKRVPRLIEEYWRGARLTAGDGNDRVGSSSIMGGWRWGRLPLESLVPHPAGESSCPIDGRGAIRSKRGDRVQPVADEGYASPPSARATRSTPSPTQSMVPGAVLYAAKRYSSLVNRYNALISDLTHVKEAFAFSLRSVMPSHCGTSRCALNRHERRARYPATQSGSIGLRVQRLVEEPR